MNSKTIITIALVLLAITGLFVWGRSNAGKASLVANHAGAPQNASRSLLVASETLHDFGTIRMANGNVSKVFTVSNPTDKSITVKTMYTSCMCTTATLEVRGEKFGPYGMPGHGFIPKINQIINLNEEASLEVVFDPAAHGPAGVGKIQRVVTIEQGGGSQLEFGFVATVTP